MYIIYFIAQNIYGFYSSFIVCIFELLYSKMLFSTINTQIMDTFGKKLRDAREARGFSQAELARQIKSHHSIIGKYERDEVKPTIDVVKRLADVLDTTVSFLLSETESQKILKDPVMFKRIADIESLPEKDKESLLLTVDNFIKATKLNML